jgi:hypothetical protein
MLPRTTRSSKSLSRVGHGLTGCGKIRDRAEKTYPFDKLPRQAEAGRAGSQGLKSVRENSPLSRPFGTDASGDLRFFSTPSKSMHFRETVPQGLKPDVFSIILRPD